MTRGVIGIVKENKGIWECRVVFAPDNVRELVAEKGIKVIVQPSNNRVFPDEQYSKAGAILSDDLAECNIIFGVKERPVAELAPYPEHAFFFFSHVIKAQEYNMKMLDHILENKITLLDYERICNRNGQRLVKFGFFAGLCGFVDTLSGLGNLYLRKGYRNPFLHIAQCHNYGTAEDIKLCLNKVGKEIIGGGLSPDLGPQVFCIVGNGDVGKGALDMLKCLPHEMIVPEDLPGLVANKNFDNKKIYGMFLGPEDTVELKEDEGKKEKKSFDVNHFFANPGDYNSTFFRDIAPYVTFVTNAVYWDKKFPRLLTTIQLEELNQNNTLRLQALSDVSSDLCGSFEFMSHISCIDTPFFIYDIRNRKNVEFNTANANIEGGRILVNSVDNLPCEVPYEASINFATNLMPFAKDLAFADFSVGEESLDLPFELKNALIAHKGDYTSKYKYILDLRRERGDL